MSDQTLIVLSPGFPGSEAETSCLPGQQVFIKALQRADPSLKIIIIAFQYPYTKERYQWNGITVIPFNGRNRGHIYRRVLWARVIGRLEILHKENKIKGILSFWIGECAYVSSLFARRYGLPEYYWILGQDAKNDNPWFKRIKPNQLSLLAISDHVADLVFNNHGLKTAHIIPIGIDPSMFVETETVRDIDILGAGSLIPLKQYDIFVRIVSDLKTSIPNLWTVICGEGPDRKSLTDSINSGGLNDTIDLKGEISHQQVIDLMRRTKIFLHPSSYEGFSSVCAEALYAGAHVVSFCKPMNKDFPQWHIVKDYDDMENKVAELLSNEIEHKHVITFMVNNAARQILDAINQGSGGR